MSRSGWARINAIRLSVGIAIYAFWPSHGKRFDKAAKSILDDEDGPCR